ncbi:MAG: RICIN domain-containing protein [Egibacteraceae bacterium]
MEESAWDGRVVRIVSRRSGYVLTAPDASQGAWIVQSKDDGLDRQRWRLTWISEPDAYKIANLYSGKILEVLAADPADGTPINQWDDNGGRHQQWYLIEHTDAAGSFYQIQNVGTGGSADVRGGPDGDESLADGAPIIQWGYQGVINQQWLISE